MNNVIKDVCVYCASSTKIPSVYFDAAERLGQLLAEQGINLINGAGRQGLMGRMSDATLACGGTVTGGHPPLHGGARMASPRADPAHRNRNHARAQTTDGRTLGRRDRTPPADAEQWKNCWKSSLGNSWDFT